jgi:hypothetical protein
MGVEIYACDMVGAIVTVAFTVVALVVWFVWLAMDAGRYQWATEAVGRFIDLVLRRSRP